MNSLASGLRSGALCERDERLFLQQHCEISETVRHQFELLSREKSGFTFGIRKAMDRETRVCEATYDGDAKGHLCCIASKVTCGAEKTEKKGRGLTQAD